MKRAGYYFVALIIAIYLIALYAVASNAIIGSMNFGVRVFALTGFYFLAWAALMSPFLIEISRKFGTSFIRLHHAFAIVGLVSTVAHPIVLSIQIASLAIFVPSFGSLDGFFRNGGRVAIYIILFSALVAVFRKRLGRSWRPLHAIIYIAFILAIVHGALIGNDFRDPAIIAIFYGLFAATMGALVLKRYRNYSKRKKADSSKAK